MMDQDRERESIANRPAPILRWLCLTAMVILAAVIWWSTPQASAQQREQSPRLDTQPATESVSPRTRTIDRTIRPRVSRAVRVESLVSDSDRHQHENNDIRTGIDQRMSAESRARLANGVGRPNGSRAPRVRIETSVLPRSSNRFVASSPDPKVAALIKQIQKQKQDGKESSAETDQLRKLLEKEFDQTHQHQADRISETEQRLAMLTDRHELRGENKDKIVQRRIASLLGEPDDLAWIPTAENVGRQPVRAVAPRFSEFQFQRADPHFSEWHVQPVPAAPARPTQAAKPTKPQPGLVAPTRAPRPPGRPATNAESEFRPGPVFQNQTRAVNADQAVSLKDLFGLAHDVADAKGKLRLAEAEMKEHQLMRGKGAVSEMENRRMKMKLAQLVREVQLYDRQIDVMRAQLKGAQEYSERVLAEFSALLAEHQAKFDMGQIDKQRLTEAEVVLLDAKRRREDAANLVKQFDAMVNEASRDPKETIDLDLDFGTSTPREASDRDSDEQDSDSAEEE